ncbi:MAG: hypothetical protein H7Z40_22810 [Phycisphaerae bacterium]|nr:hypothetical protein [Gemmatimonadaceae bacterium]
MTVVATDANASEVGPDIGTFTFTRTGAATSALDVAVTFSGAATNGTDYGSVSSTVTFPLGATSVVLTIAPLADALVEGAESAVVTIVPGAAYDVGAGSTATVTIADVVPKPQVSVAATDASASEAGSDNGVFTLTRTGATTSALVISVAMSGTAANGTDYAQVLSTVSIPVGASTATVTVTPVADAAVEGAETVILTVGSSSLYDVGTPPSATVTIADVVVAGGGTLVNGVTETGRIAFAAQTHSWTFTATQGDRIVLSIGETGVTNAQFTPWIRLLAPGGAQAAQDFGAGAAQIDVIANATGTFTVVVASSDGGAVGIGDYRLTLVKVPGVLSVSPGDEGGSITNAALHNGNIYLGDVDAWTITAAAGERIIVSLAEIGVFSATFQPHVRVSGPTGAQVSQNTQQFQAAQVDFYAPTAGTYTIIIGSFNLDGTGDYRLTVVKAPGTFTTSPNDEGAVIVNGANHAGTIALGDIDPWTITAAAGERIIVSLAETGVFNATFQPQIRVSGPTGAQVAQNTQQFQAAQVDFYAPTAGTYTIVVGSFDLNGTGDYRLTVVKAPGTFTTSPGDEGTAS